LRALAGKDGKLKYDKKEREELLKTESPLSIRRDRTTFWHLLGSRFVVRGLLRTIWVASFILMHQGHAYSGCWLEERTLPEPCIDDLQHIRKLAADSLITVFETTLHKRASW
jgi:hypothetical protein